MLEKKAFPTIKVGIGLSTSQELVVKAGRQGVGINNKVWIGDAVTKASNLSSLGNKNGYSSIVLSSFAYDNIIDEMVKNNGEKIKILFQRKYDRDYGYIYYANLIKTDFYNWIDKNIP